MVAEAALWGLIGALVFFVGDLLIERLGGKGRKSSASPEEENSGLGIVLGTVLDGIPESAVLGMSLATGDGVSMAPEAYSRAAMATGLATTLGFILATFLTSFE